MGVLVRLRFVVKHKSFFANTNMNFPSAKLQCDKIARISATFADKDLKIVSRLPIPRAQCVKNSAMC